MKGRVCFEQLFFSLLFLQTTLCAAHSLPCTYELGNEYLSRTFEIDKQGHLRTVKIENRRAQCSAQLLQVDEFRLRVSQGTDVEGTDRILTSADFLFEKATHTDHALVFELQHVVSGLKAEVIYTLHGDEFFMRKQLRLTANQPLCLERIDVESLEMEDAYQPYQIKEITTHSHKRTYNPGWRPGLGQPLFTKTSATFWGIEFPASYNYVEGTRLLCGYQYGRRLQPGQRYESYSAVMGVSDDPWYNSDAFYDYIDQVRIPANKPEQSESTVPGANRDQ